MQKTLRDSDLHPDLALPTDLLKPPPKKLRVTDSNEHQTFERKAADCELRVRKFVHKNADYQTQYAPLYFHRLQTMRPWVLQRLQQSISGKSSGKSGSKKGKEESSGQQSGAPPVCDKLIEVVVGQACLVVGTLFKDMPLRPTALDVYADERNVAPPSATDNYMSPEDALILEDETGRARLIGSVLDPKDYVTGMVVGLRGVETTGGEFDVAQIVLPGLGPQSSIPKPLASEKRRRRYVLLASGLHVGDTHVNPLLQQLLIDFVAGHAGGPQDQDFSSLISRVVLAGNSVFNRARDTELDGLKHHHQALSEAAEQSLLTPVQNLDTVLAQLCASCPVDIMPGDSDPSNSTMPQQPFNVALFPYSSRYNTFSAVTNPYESEVEGVRFLGTSGQNLSNIEQYMDVGKDRLSFFAGMLQWRHTVPTAPDTLPCYPFFETDPFIMHETPHVWFVGNQHQYGSCLVEGEEGQKVRVVMLPTFVETKTAVLVDLADLSVHPITFNIDN